MSTGTQATTSQGSPSWDASPVRWSGAYIVVTTIVIGAMCAIWLINMLTLTPVYGLIWRLLKSDRPLVQEDNDLMIKNRLSTFKACGSRLNAFILAVC